MRRITTVTVLSMAGVLLAAGAAAALNTQVLQHPQSPIGTADRMLPDEFLSTTVSPTADPSDDAEPSESAESPESASPSKSAKPSSSSASARPSRSTAEPGDDNGGDRTRTPTFRSTSGSGGDDKGGDDSSGSGSGKDDSKSDDSSGSGSGGHGSDDGGSEHEDD